MVGGDDEARTPKKFYGSLRTLLEISFLKSKFVTSSLPRLYGESKIKIGTQQYSQHLSGMPPGIRY